jgi:hypothetical protein
MFSGSPKNPNFLRGPDSPSGNMTGGSAAFGRVRVRVRVKVRVRSGNGS